MKASSPHGHGIVPETPVDNVNFLVDYVHEHSGGD
jgi:uroporphyrinogen-III decarboxylase